MTGESNPPQAKGFYKVSAGQTYDESSSNALLGLFLFSALMFTLPLIVFFGSRHILETQFNVTAPYSHLAPVILAVIVVNIIIIAYVFKAFREDSKEHSHEAEGIEHRKKKE